jgi:HSP20 family protein
MVLARRSEKDDLGNMERQMERFLDRYVAGWKRPLVTFGTEGWQPAIDLYETSESVVLVADISGMRVDQIEITIDRGHLILRGSRPEPPRRGKALFHVLEINRGPFLRAIHLPLAVDPDGTTAIYQDGFLEIEMPKAARRPTTKVQIRPG